MAFVTDSNRPQLRRQPPPTACLTASGAASEVPSLLLHLCSPPPHWPPMASPRMASVNEKGTQNTRRCTPIVLCRTQRAAFMAPPQGNRGMAVHRRSGGGGGDTSRSTGRSRRQNAATRRNMRREDRVTVQGPVKKLRPNGMSHGGGGGFPRTSPLDPPLPHQRDLRAKNGISRWDNLMGPFLVHTLSVHTQTPPRSNTPPPPPHNSPATPPEGRGRGSQTRRTHVVPRITRWTTPRKWYAASHSVTPENVAPMAPLVPPRAEDHHFARHIGSSVPGACHGHTHFVTGRAWAYKAGPRRPKSRRAVPDASGRNKSCVLPPPPPPGRHRVTGTGNSPVSGTADPRSSQTGQVIRGLC